MYTHGLVFIVDLVSKQSRTASALKVQNVSGTLMSLSNEGKFGIGTQEPSSSLHIDSGVEQYDEPSFQISDQIFNIDDGIISSTRKQIHKVIKKLNNAPTIVIISGNSSYIINTIEVRFSYTTASIKASCIDKVVWDSSTVLSATRTATFQTAINQNDTYFKVGDLPTDIVSVNNNELTMKYGDSSQENAVYPTSGYFVFDIDFLGSLHSNFSIF